ncbi:MAG: zinc-dependent metalloprotease family protein, partial [Ginsengibacter sp.]
VSVLNVPGIKNFLWSLPSEGSIFNRRIAQVIELPMPDGRMEKFQVWESSIMEPGLVEKFPEMKTFAGQGIDDPAASIRFDFNPYFGFHAQILSPKGRVYIDPYARFDVNNYISYYTSDYPKTETFICGTETSLKENLAVPVGPCRGTQLYKYRLALACTGEYAVAVAGANPTLSAVAAAILTSVNRVSGVYESELAVRLSLIANNNLLIYLDGATDPYTNNNGRTMLEENQANIDNIIGTANYDIGHVYSTGGGGIARLGVVCLAGFKAQGVTGRSNPVGDPFNIDYVAHEMGHQFGASHTFNNNSLGSCEGNRNANTAYEVGGGTTIMAYAGICSSDDIQPNSDPFFHSVSFDEISNYLESGGTCKVATATGNSIPVITSMANNGVSIPRSTPFTLTGTATDANGDALTYCWEEWDTGPETLWNGGNANTTSPLFKSRVPKTNASRTFPDIAYIIANYLPAVPPAIRGGLKGETLPTQPRTMNFRLTVRDNRAGGGGVATGGNGCAGSGFTAPFQVNITNSSPFLVSIPNGGEIFYAGSAEAITWDPAFTAAAPISVANVKISLSTDGGFTYPVVIAASTPNDGSEVLTIPSAISTTARIKIEAVGNIFFDISNANFTINAAPTSGFNFSAPPSLAVACPAAGPLDINLGTIPFGGFSNTITLIASGAPAGTTVSFVPGNTVIPGNDVTIRITGTSGLPSGTYSITITGTATGAITKTRVITFIINPGAGPVITTQPVSQTVCSGSNATFTVEAAGTYQWQVSTAAVPAFTNIPGATSSTLILTSVTSDMNGNQYRAIINGQCGGSTSNAATLTVRQLPTVTLTASPLTSLLPGQTTTLTATTSAQTTGILSTTWLFNGNPISNTGNIRIVGIESVGTYQVNIQEVFAGGLVCASQSAAVIITAVVSDKLFIFPSPNNGQFTVSYFNSGGASTTRSVSIFDSKGAKVHVKNFPITGVYTLLNIDIRAAQKGLYFVVVGDANGKVLTNGKVLILK